MDTISTTITGKIALLLSKTRDAIISDLRNEIVDVRFFSEPTTASLSKNSEQLVACVNTVFVKIGIDFSSCETLIELGDKLIYAISEIESIAEVLNEAADDKDGLEKVLDVIVPAFKKLIDIIKNFSSEKAEETYRALGTEITDALSEFDYKEFVKRIVDHVIMVLLRNAKDVFADEIEFVEAKARLLKEDIEKVINTIDNTIDNIEEELQDTYEEVKRDISDFSKEAEAELQVIANRLKREYNDEKGEFLKSLNSIDIDNNAYAKVAKAFSITYAILDFVGIISHKTVTLKLPKSFTNTLKNAKQEVVERFSKGIETIKDEVGNVKNDITDSLSDTKDEITNAVGNAEKQFDQIAGSLNISQAKIATAITQLTSLEVATATEKGLLELGGDIQKAYDVISADVATVGDQFTKAAVALNGKADDILEKISSFSYSVNITIIDLSKTELLFTSPIKHFKQLYPIDCFDDAKELMERFVNLLHLINPNIPDFSTLISMLETLLKKLKDRLLRAYNEMKAAVMESDVYKTLSNFLTDLINKVEYVINLLKTLGRKLKENIDDLISDVKIIVNSIGNQIEYAVNSYYRELSALSSSVEKEIGGEIDKILNEAKDGAAELLNESERALEQAYNELKEKGATEINSAKAELLSIIKDIKIDIPSIAKIDLQYDILQPSIAGLLDIDIFAADEMGIDSAAIKKEFEHFAKYSKEQITVWAKEVGASIRVVVSPDIWSDRFEGVLAQIKKEFDADLQTITSLISAEGAKQLITNFNATKNSLANSLDINSYINIFRTAIDDVILPDPELYYDNFKNIVCKNILNEIVKLKENLKNELKGQGEEILKNLDSKLQELIDKQERAIEDLAAQLWKRVRSEIIDPIIKSLKKSLTTVVRRVIRLLLNRIIEELTPLKERAERVKREIEKGVEISNDLLSAVIAYITSDLGFKDTINLAISIFKSVPKELYDKVDDLLPDLFRDNDFTNYFKELDYTCDIDNMVVSATLLDLSKLIKKGGKKNDSGTKFDADVKLQVMFSVDEYRYKTLETDEEEKSTSALKICLSLKGMAGLEFDIGDNHSMEIKAAGDIGNTDKNGESEDKKEVGFYLTKEIDGGRFHAIGCASALGFLLYIYFARKEGAAKANWLESRYLDINVKNYPQIAYVGYNPSFENSGNTQLGLPEKFSKILGDEKRDGFQIGYIASIEDLEFVLKVSKNDFLKNFVKDDISLALSTYLGYDKEDGLKIGGGYNLHCDFDFNNKKLGCLSLGSCGIDLGSNGCNFGSLNFNINTNFNVDFSAFTLAFENLGLGFDTTFLKPDFSFGDFDFDLNFKFPTGIGISIDTVAVKGAGFISIDLEKGEFFGSIEIRVVDKFGVAGFVLCDTGAKSGMFSLATLITASFSPGIPLGMGFSLTGVGGCLGLNRMLDRKGIMDGVRQGTLKSVFFVSDLANHLSEVKSNAEKFFPAKKNQFYLGLLGQISFEPVVKCDFGLMLQLPDPTEIIIVGALNVSVGEDDFQPVCINVYFAGGINFEEGIWFDASIIDSQIVGLELSGDMAFRLFWGGANKGFLMSVGGFHPAYIPEEGLMVSNMKRLSIGMDYDILRIKLESYFAVTSNSFQIGADLDLKIGWDKFGITGYAGFDALFQFDPFLFMFNVRAGVSVKCGSWTLMSIDLSMDVQGPAPWKISGSAKFWFVFIPIKVGFNLEWGDDTPELPSEEIDILPLLEKEIESIYNWTVQTPEADESVILCERDGAEKVIPLQPYTRCFSFNQSQLPFKTVGEECECQLEKMDICNNARPIDYCSIEIAGISMDIDDPLTKEIEAVPIEKFDSLKNDFAPALYKNLSLKEKLKVRSYEKYNSGFSFDIGDNDFKSEDAVTLDFSAYHICRESTTENHCLKKTTVRQTSPVCRDKAAFKRYVKSLDSRRKS